MEIEEKMLPIEEQNIIEHELIILTKQTLFSIFKQKNCSNLLALYCFYYYTAKIQKTNQPRVSISFVANALKWDTKTVQKYKSELIKLGLISNVIKRNPETNEITGWYVKINFIWKKETISKRLRLENDLNFDKNSSTPPKNGCLDIDLCSTEQKNEKNDILNSATHPKNGCLDIGSKIPSANLSSTKQKNEEKARHPNFPLEAKFPTNAYSEIAIAQAPSARAQAVSCHCPSGNVCEPEEFLASPKKFFPTTGETPDPLVYPPAPDDNQLVKSGDQQTEISEPGTPIVEQPTIGDMQLADPAEIYDSADSAERSSAERPTPGKPKPQAEKFGREEINSILDRLKAKLGIHDFADTQNWIRRYGRHLARLEREIGEENFWRRVETLMADSFHSRNLSRPRYLYQAIKGMADAQLDWRKEWYKFHVLTLGAFADQPVSQYADDLMRREQNYFLFPDKRSLADLHMDYFFNQEYLVEYCYRQSAIEEAVQKVLVPEELELRDFENMVPVYLNDNKTPLIFRRGKKVDPSWKSYLSATQWQAVVEKGFELSTP